MNEPDSSGDPLGEIAESFLGRLRRGERPSVAHYSERYPALADEIRELLRQCDAIGSKSLPLVALAGAATGVVLSLQTRDSLTRFGAKAFLPAVIVFSIIKESGPIITGLIVSGRVGAGIGAELGSMKVTEQIDAMEASAVDPYKFLVATRVAG